MGKSQKYLSEVGGQNKHETIKHTLLSLCPSTCVIIVFPLLKVERLFNLYRFTFAMLVSMVFHHQ